MKPAGRRMRLLLPGVACAALCARGEPLPSDTVRLASAAGSTAMVAPMSTRRIPLFGHPKDIREDYVYPPVFTQQRLIWADADMEWRMRFPPRRYAYAGIKLRRPVDLSLDRPRARLAFKFKPAGMAPFLSIALVGGGDGQLPVLTDYWLQDVGALSGDDWANIEVALASFPAEGMAVGPVGAAVDEKPRVFDWGAVREIRFVSGGGRVPHQEITVKQVRIQR